MLKYVVPLGNKHSGLRIVISVIWSQWLNAKVSISKNDSAAETPQYGVVLITASATGYASWTTSIAVEY